MGGLKDAVEGGAFNKRGTGKPIKKALKPPTKAQQDAEAEAEAARNAEKNARARFREQCYLVAQLREVANLNQPARGGASYKKFTSIMQTDPNDVMNQLLRFTGMTLLNDLTHAQISSLVPMVRVFLVKYKGSGARFNASSNIISQQEFPFQGTHIDRNKILKDPTTRSGALGIKGFEWNLYGVDVDAADKQIRVKLTLAGDSLRVFENKIFESLLLLGAVPGQFHAFKFLVGWSPPHGSDLFKNNKVMAGIRNQNMSMMVNFNQHNFNFNQDGSFELELDGNGYIENLLAQVNLLGPISAAEEKQDYDLFTAKQELRKKKKASDASGAGKKVAKVGKKQGNNMPSGAANQQFSGLFGAMNAAWASVIDGFKKQKLKWDHAMLKAQIQEKEKKRNSERYSRIIKSIEGLSSEGKIYNVAVSQEALANYFNNYGGFATQIKPKDPKSAPKKKSGKPPARKPAPKPKSVGTASSSQVKLLTKVTSANVSPTGEVNIQFFFLGDLIEGILKLHDYQISKQRVNILVGTMTYKNHFTQKEEIVNLVDIPIAVRRYGAWFHKKYVKKEITVITFNEFLRDVVTELVRPAFTAECFADMGHLGASANRVFFTAFNSGKKVKKGRVSLQSVRGIFSNKNTQGNNLNNYIFLTANMIGKPAASGNPAQDMRRGVMHFSLGRDKGLLKEATFSKVSMPLMRSHNMVMGTGGAIDRIKEPYVADLSMVGNCIMRPGMQFYLTPTIAGSGGGQIASRLGLGGYYTVIGVDNSISPGTFNTEVRTRFDYYADLSKKAKKKASIGSVTSGKAKSLKGAKGQKIKK